MSFINYSREHIALYAHANIILNVQVNDIGKLVHRTSVVESNEQGLNCMVLNDTISFICISFDKIGF